MVNKSTHRFRYKNFTNFKQRAIDGCQLLVITFKKISIFETFVIKRYLEICLTEHKLRIENLSYSV